MFKTIVLNVGICLIYIISGKLGLTLAFANPSATAVWPPTGIALVALLIFGIRVAPAIFLGAFIVNITTAGNIITSLGISTGNTLEGITGAYLVKRFANGVHVFESVFDIFKFVLVAVILSTAISATIGVTTLLAYGLTSANTYLSVWITWWLGDMGGNLIIAPLLLSFRKILQTRINRKQVFNFCISFLTLFIITEIVFNGTLPYSYLCIPIAVWIAFWFGQRGAAVATIFVAGIAIFYTINDSGPFANEFSIDQSLLLVQLFLGVFSLTVFIFAAILSEKRKSEKVVASHEERFRALIENSFDSVVLIDATSKILYASPSVKRLLGYTPEELQGVNGFSLVLQEDRNKTIRTLAELVVKPGSVVTVEYRTVRKDNKIIWIEATGTNLLFEPNIHAVVVNFHDITEKKLAQDKILEEKVQDEAMLTSIGEGIIATDNKGIITMLNQAACDILGWKQKELLGKFVVSAIPMRNESDEEILSTERPLTKVLSFKKEIVSSLTNFYIKKDNTRVPIRFTVTPIVINNEIVGTIEVFYDITREKEVDKAKTEFVSLASHQLRTPLATINWYLEQLMKQKNMTKQKQKSYFEEVYNASNRMIDLINTLLNTSRLELGTFIVNPKDISLIKITEQILQDFQPQIDKMHLHIQKEYQKDVPNISADPKLVAIIIQNLVSNAVKYNKSDGVITIQLRHDTEKFLIGVIDTGYGIPKDQQVKIFTKMFRADNAKSIDPEGTGLGLYIVKTIADVAGGKVWFTSSENKETAFFVTFPATGMRRKIGEKQLR